MIHDRLSEQIIASAFEVHNALGSGFLEKVYENAMVIALRKRGLSVVQQCPLPVYYENQIVGDYYADLMVEELLIVELKAVEKIYPIHEVQLVNYLQSARIEVGLLINFGSSVDVKRRYRTLKGRT
ncbi:MAG: GxxExxY protein [Bacteroidetes bacterium]|nr:MAG: GxxExxY protein [Bacteroidota bacterium]